MTIPSKPFDLNLYLVTDRALVGKRCFETCVEEAILGGVTLVQLREKSVPTEDYIERARPLKEVTDRHGVPLIINDRVDVALAIDAAGVHLGANDMPIREARAVLDEAVMNKTSTEKKAPADRMILGATARTIDAARAAERDGADYLGVGAVFPTGTKDDTIVIGLDGLLAIRRAVKIPIVAIAGINETNAPRISRQYADGIAVVSAILGNDNPREAAQQLARRK